MPPITGPGECVANDVVSLESVLLSDGHRVALLPSPVLRCSMAETVTDWVRDDVAPIIATLDTALRNVETLDSFAVAGAMEQVAERSVSMAVPTHSMCAR